MPEDYRGTMRPVILGQAAVVALAVLLAGCAGAAVPNPADTTPTTPPAATASPDGPPSGPPLAPDLAGGTPLQLGSAGHWAIATGSAFAADDNGTVVAFDLATGSRRWQAGFSLGKPWDARPTLGLSADRTTVIAARTVDADGATALDLLLLDAASGTAIAEHLVTDPDGRWMIDLPPRILAADDTTAVLADDPESGRQTAVVEIAGGTLAWQVDDQAVAATADTVVTRGAGWSRDDGTRLWQNAAPLGPLLAQSPGALVVQGGTAGVWLDPGTGSELARTGSLAESEPPCAATIDTLVCLGDGVTGYELSTGQQLWHSADPAEAVAILAEWAYLWRRDGRGDVLDARTGQILVTDAELPALRYFDDTGVLLSGETGYSWVPFVS